ncbi:MAG: Rad52/Rad22 family DNA repair protein [Oscillibacter sp.]
MTNRAIQNRLDEVCGPENWYNDFKPWHSNGKKEAQLCGIAIFFEGRGFITKWDGAEDSDIEAVKGGLSDSMKRAAVNGGSAACCTTLIPSGSKSRSAGAAL